MAAETDAPVALSDDTTADADAGSRQGRLLLLLGKKALIAGAPLVAAKAVGAKAGYAGATIVKSGAVAGASGLSGLAGVSGLAGLGGLGGLAGV